MKKMTAPLESMRQDTGTGNRQKTRMLTDGKDLKIACSSCDTHILAKAFIVTDDVGLRGILKYALDLYDIQPLFCQGGENALAFTVIDQFDHIILDCDTPGMNSIEHVKKLREQFAGAVIIGLGKEDRGVAYLQAGMNDFLKKPFVPYRLAMMLDGRDILA